MPMNNAFLGMHIERNDDDKHCKSKMFVVLKIQITSHKVNQEERKNK